jgi:alkanesulfonate monooxygenase SsuD/methylene tetrahydromethanopterin reductase-like flavin-dependent oxidoreductase (luciferase family)
MEAVMRVGVFHFPTDYGIAIGELAQALEARGFDSLFVCEHTHIPVSRRTPFPSGGELPKRYKHTHDPFGAAASSSRSAAAGTSRRWRITVRATRRASSCCASACSP